MEGNYLLDKYFDLEESPPELSIILDCTSSMSQVMRFLPEFLMSYCIKRSMAQNPVAKISVVGFDDHYPEYKVKAWMSGSINIKGNPWFNNPLRDLHPSDNLEEIAYFINSLPVGWGGDPQEAFSCAIQRSREIHKGGDVARWLITDSYPHGSVSMKTSDDYPLGCPCGVKLDLTGVSLLYCRDGTEYVSWLPPENKVLRFNDIIAMSDARSKEEY